MKWKCQNMFVYLTQSPPPQGIQLHGGTGPETLHPSLREHLRREKNSGSGTTSLLRVTSGLVPFSYTYTTGYRLKTGFKMFEVKKQRRKRPEPWPDEKEKRRSLWISGTQVGGRKKKVCCHQTPAYNQKIPFCDSRQTLFSFTWCIKCWIS